MRSRLHWIPAAAIAIALTGLAATGAQAQTALFSYAAKFVCGKKGNDQSVVQGLYETSVNIHNPHFSRVIARKKAVIALPQSADPGPISKYVREPLRADGAVGVNCRDIRRLFDPIPTGFIEGFVVVLISSSTPLDVTDVITARQRTGDVETVSVHQVVPTRVVQ